MCSFKNDIDVSGPPSLHDARILGGRPALAGTYSQIARANDGPLLPPPLLSRVLVFKDSLMDALIEQVSDNPLAPDVLCIEPPSDCDVVDFLCSRAQVLCTTIQVYPALLWLPPGAAPCKSQSQVRSPLLGDVNLSVRTINTETCVVVGVRWLSGCGFTSLQPQIAPCPSLPLLPPPCKCQKSVACARARVQPKKYQVPMVPTQTLPYEQGVCPISFLAPGSCQSRPQRESTHGA